MADAARPRLTENERPTLLSRIEGLVRTALPRGAVILSSVTLVNYAVGWLETKVVSHQFGAGTDTDAFNAAFLLPALVLDFLVVGGLISCFVPLYTGLKDEDRDEAERFARTIFTLAIVATTAAMAVLFVLAPTLVSVFFPGFQQQQHDLCVDLFRILILSQILFAGIWVLGEVLIAERSWLAYAVAQIAYSVGIIAGSLALGDLIGIYGAAVGAVLGAAAYLAIRLYGAWRAGFRPLPSFDLHVNGLRRYAGLMWPKMLSQPLEGSLTALYFGALASTLAIGSVTYVKNATRFETMAVLVIGTQFAIASFPSLSAAADMGKRREFRRLLGTNLATVTVLSTVAALGLLILGGLIVQVLLGGGEYTATDVHQTALLLGVFAIAVPLESMIEVVARGMYATKNTLIPTGASVMGFATIFVSSQLLIHPVGLLALPASYALGMAVKLGIIWLALMPRVDAIGRPIGGQAEPRDMAFLLSADGRDGTRRSTARMAAGVVAVTVLGSVGLYTGFQALHGATFGYAPEVTPWARVRPSAAVATPTIGPSIVVSPGPSTSPGASPTPTATPPGHTLAPGATPTPPGQFAMDLYRPGDFVGEFKNTHCVPAAMQTMMNIMDEGSDTTATTQEKLFALANSIAESRQGSPDPEGWSGGLQELGYGNYAVDARRKEIDAVKLVVKQIRLTNRPAGLLVWKGWHSWVVSGFVASADPATTDDFTVLGLYIEDVWYNRHSSLWNQSRGGYSRPPDSYVPYASLAEDFKPWDQAVYYKNKQANFVVVIPTA